MGQLGQWLRMLVGLVLITSLFDMLLPENDFKKIAKLVMGLVIMLGILQPVLALVNNNWNDWHLSFQIQEQTDGIDWNQRGEYLLQAGITPVIRYATNSIEEQVEMALAMNELIEDAKITTHLNTSGELQQVEIIILASSELTPDLEEQVKAEATKSVANFLQISETFISVELG